MQARLRTLENLDTGKRLMHLKIDPGGVADVEFMVQYIEFLSTIRRSITESWNRPLIQPQLSSLSASPNNETVKIAANTAAKETNRY